MRRLVLLGSAAFSGPAPGQKADPKLDRKPAYFKVVLPHDNATLKFDIDARALSQARVFRSIAEHFAWA